MTRRPPTSPLSPYPPLFRSSSYPPVELVGGVELLVAAGVTRELEGLLGAEGEHAEHGQAPVQETEDAVLERPVVQRVDRKSTRLNSSHGYISYAVFCLKKKN